MGNFGLSNDQQRFQMAFWSLIMSPLFVSTDLRTLGPDSKRILLNRRVIDVNQDPLADMPTQIQAVKRPMQNNDPTYTVHAYIYVNSVGVVEFEPEGEGLRTEIS